MKKTSIAAMGIVLCTCILTASGQPLKTRVKANIAPYALGIAYDRTTNLIFPYSIRSVDRGSADVIAQQAEGTENILQVKAGKRDFKQTNLTVITGEGALYSFLLSYNPQTPLLNLKITELAFPVETVASLSDGRNEAVVQDIAKRVAVKQPARNGPRVERFDVRMAVRGIYIHKDILYVQLELQNDSHIGYDVDQFRWFFQDRRRSKRTASQEQEILPLYVEGNCRRIAGTSRQTVVIALDKFTIPDKKKLVIQLFEQNGGRHLELTLKNRQLVTAKQL